MYKSVYGVMESILKNKNLKNEEGDLERIRKMQLYRSLELEKRLLDKYIQNIEQNKSKIEIILNAHSMLFSNGPYELGGIEEFIQYNFGTDNLKSCLNAMCTTYYIENDGSSNNGQATGEVQMVQASSRVYYEVIEDIDELQSDFSNYIKAYFCDFYNIFLKKIGSGSCDQFFGKNLLKSACLDMLIRSLEVEKHLENKISKKEFWDKKGSDVYERIMNATSQGLPAPLRLTQKNFGIPRKPCIEEVYVFAVINTQKDRMDSMVWLLLNSFPQIGYSRWNPENILVSSINSKKIDTLLRECIHDYIYSPIMLEVTMFRWMLREQHKGEYVESYVTKDISRRFDKASQFGIRHRKKKSGMDVGKEQKGTFNIVKEFCWDFFRDTSSVVCDTRYNYDIMTCIYNSRKDDTENIELFEAYSSWTGAEVCVELICDLGGICLYKDRFKEYQTEIDLLLEEIARYIKVFGRNTVYMIHKLFEVVKKYKELYVKYCERKDKKYWDWSAKNPDGGKYILRVLTEALSSFNIEEICVTVFENIESELGEIERICEEENISEKITGITVENMWIKYVNEYGIRSKYEELHCSNEYKFLRKQADLEQLKSSLKAISQQVEIPVPQESFTVDINKMEGRWYCILQKIMIKKLNDIK